jgi:hypothetical protein
MLKELPNLFAMIMAIPPDRLFFVIILVLLVLVGFTLYVHLNVVKVLSSPKVKK